MSNLSVGMMFQSRSSVPLLVIGAKLMFMAFQLPRFSQHQDEGDSTEEQRHACQAQPHRMQASCGAGARGREVWALSVAIAVSKKTNSHAGSGDNEADCAYRERSVEVGAR